MLMENNINFEKGPERVLSKEEVMKELLVYAENGEIVKELSDEKGLYMLYIEIKGEKPGETIQYEYDRKGVYPNNRLLKTSIELVYYRDGMPIGGETVTVYDPDTNQWIKAE